MLSLDELKNELTDWHTAYAEIPAPPTLEFSISTFNFASEAYCFHISRHGLNFLLYRLQEYVNKDKARHLFKDNKAEFCKYINFCFRKMRTMRHKEARREHFIAAFLIHLDRIDLEGLLTNYNPISNKQVVEMVENSGLADRLTWATYDRSDMQLFLKSKVHRSDDLLTYGLVIRNGETGRAALSYNACINVSNYYYTWPLQASKRHLSKISNAVDNLSIALEECENIEIFELLRTTPVEEIPIAVKNKDIMDIVWKYKNKPASVATQKTMNQVMKYIENKLRRL